MFLSYNAPHTPIQPPKEWTVKVMKREKGITQQQAKLVALIEHMDEGIGRVLSAIEEKDNTIVIFTSDNGGQANVGARNHPWRGEKQQMWEGGIRVPACIVWPDKVKGGSKYSGDSMSMDWMPTLMDIVGAKKNELLDGSAFGQESKGKMIQIIRIDASLGETRRRNSIRRPGLLCDSQGSVEIITK